MGDGLDSRLDELEMNIRRDDEAESREMLEFAKELRESEGYKALSSETKERVDLYIKAYSGEEEALFELSDKMS